MSKKHNRSKNKILVKSELLDALNDDIYVDTIDISPKNMEESEDISDIDTSDVDLDKLDLSMADFDDDIDIDEDLEKRMSLYEFDFEDDIEEADTSVSNDEQSDVESNTDEQEKEFEELDIIGQSDMKEFVSRRDNDVVARSRQRVNQPGRRVVKGAKEKKEKAPKTRASQLSGSQIHKLIEYYNNNTMKVLYSCLGTLVTMLLVVISVIMIKGIPADSKKDLDNETGRQEKTTAVVDEETTKPDEIQTQAESETTVDFGVEPETENSEIYKLIKAYINAAYVNNDLDEMKLYVDDLTNINVDELKYRRRYIESYNNIKCYRFDTDVNGSYVVFATYDLNIVNANTPAPGGTMYIVNYNSDDKKFYIHNMKENEELDAYIASKAAEINLIGEDVKKRFDDAMSKDEELKKVFELMSNAGKKPEEQGTAAN